MWPFSRKKSNTPSPGVGMCRPSGMTPVEAVSFYRHFGFFQDEDAPQVLDRYENEIGKPFDSSNPWDDVFLLSMDKAHAWADDPECDLSEGEYRRFFKELAAITNGGFNPQDVQEHWETEEGPITVSFRQGDSKHTVQPEWHDDWLDLSILSQLNKSVSGSGRSFVLAADVNHALILFLTDNEIHQFKQERHFPFTEPPQTLW